MFVYLFLKQYNTTLNKISKILTTVGLYDYTKNWKYYLHYIGFVKKFSSLMLKIHLNTI